MQLKPLLDAGWAFGFAIFGTYIMAVGIPLTIVLETIIIRQIFFKTKKFWMPVSVTIFINLISGAAGLLLAYPFFMSNADRLSIALTGMPTTHYEIAPLVSNTLGLLMFLGTLLLSIAIEGVILTLFFRGKFSLTTIWLTAVGINIISYFGFFLLGVSLIQLEWSVPIMIAVASIYAVCLYLLSSWGLKASEDRV